MQLEKLQIQGYRNLREVSLDTSAQFVVFYGDNGQGKTNLIEAICSLATLKSFRTHRISDQIQWGASEAYVRGTIVDQGHRRKLTLSLSKEGRKATIDGKSPNRLAEYFESIRAVVFAPEHVELIRGVPEGRRSFVDRGCFTLQPSYLALVREFKRLLSQRAVLLRSDRFDLAHMEVLENQLACSGARISFKRRAFVQALDKPFVELHTQLTGCSDVGIRYRGSLGEGSEEEQAEIYRHLLAEKRQDERMRGKNLVGPQRDDLLVSLNQQNARYFASQGQARALVLSLKLAELDLARRHGAKPLFLLDDLSSELDAKRRQKLVEILDEKALQVFVSTTSLKILEKGLENTLKFQVVEGGISQ